MVGPNLYWIILVPQLTHMASCGWWKGDSESMWGHPSTNHNLPHERVVTQVVALELSNLYLLLEFRLGTIQSTQDSIIALYCNSY